MVAIPKSPGIQARPTMTTPTVRQPVNTGEQYIAQGVSQLGGAIADVGAIAMVQEQRQQQAYEASKILDYKNQLRRFDNEEKIRLSELGATPEVIEQSKKDISDRRKLFAQELKQGFGDNKRLQALAQQEEENSFVDFEYAIDKDLSSKRKEYAQNTFFQNISDLRNDFENSTSPQEQAIIARDLGNIQQTALSAGIVDYKDLERIEKDFRELRKEKERELINRSAFEMATRGELLLDPSSKEDRDIINSNFEKYYLDSEDPMSLAIELSANTGVVPEIAKKMWTSQLLNGSPQQKIETAQTLTMLQRENPKLQAQFSDQEKSFAQAIQSRIGIGLSDEQIVELAENEINKNLDKEKLVRKQEFEKDIGHSGKKYFEKLDEIKKDLKDRSGFTIFNPEVENVPNELALDIINTARDFYINNGSNIDDSMELAQDTVLSQWGLTEIGKKRYQKYSPEIMYPEMTPKEIKKQVYRTVKDRIPLENDENIVLLPIPETLNSNNPAYLISIKNEYNGIMTEDVLRGNDNMPIKFIPDVTKTERYKENKALKESLALEKMDRKERLKAVRKAKQEQEQKIKRISIGIQSVKEGF